MDVPGIGGRVVALDEAGRIRLTTSCRDTDAIPKVDLAGALLDGSQGRVQVMHNGVRIEAGCYYGDWMTEIIRALRGHHEPQEEVVFHALVERLPPEASPVMVELGAFWAYYSLWFLERCPAGRAVLVEPDPNYLAVGQRNFELNGRHGTFLQAAVGDATATETTFECESDGRVRTVPVVSLEELLARFELDHIDVLLLDVQGAEVGFLRGALDLLAERVRFVIVSTHHHVTSGDPLTHQRCLELVEKAGGTVISEHSVAESYSGDGMIAASFDPRDAGLRVEVSRARAGESLFGDSLPELAYYARRACDLEADLSAATSAAAALEDELTANSETLTWRLHRQLTARPMSRRLMARIGSLVRRRR